MVRQSFYDGRDNKPDEVDGYRLSQRHDRRATPLDDVRVVEISDRIAGSYCGKLLADAGADVMKIEPPQGGSVAAVQRQLLPDTRRRGLTAVRLPQRRQTRPDLVRVRVRVRVRRTFAVAQ